MADVGYKRVVKILLLLIACMIACASPCPAGAADASTTAMSDANVQQVKQVVEKFRTSIIAKNKDALTQLSLNDGISFVSVDDDAYIALERSKVPSTKKADASGSYGKFVDFIATSKDREEEKFSNIKIQTDGLVATVYFDYTFQINDMITNWGHETWGLVKTDNGWKISSIVYSVSVDLEKMKKCLGMPNK